MANYAHKLMIKLQTLSYSCLKKVIIFEREIIKRLILPSTNFIRKIKVRGSKVTDLGRLRKRDT